MTQAPSLSERVVSEKLDHFLSIAATSTGALHTIMDRAAHLRAERQRGIRHEPILAGVTLAMLFEKPSLRTRVSFEQGMLELGGHALVLGQNEVGLGQRESVADVSRVLSGMVQGIAARVFRHDDLVELAAYSPVPVINMLSDLAHPAQALADLMTLADEFAPADRDGRVDWARLRGRTLVFVGDGNNVARSLALICGRFGLNFVLASPRDYSFDSAFLERARQAEPGLSIDITHDAVQAVRHADAIYADTFVSMGQEDEKQQRLQDFSGFAINEQLLAAAPDHAIVLHCLPAYRGIEITDGVMDGPRSRVFPQAHNRLHAQKGLLAHLLAR